MAKPWYKSKTIWFNALIAAAGSVLAARGINLETVAAPIIAAVGAINAVLRSITREPLGDGE